MILPRPAPAASPLALADLPRDFRGIVVEHAMDPGTTERLWALGLGLGAPFTVMQAGRRPTVRVGETRIAVGCEIARAVRAILQ